jgi:hypothetical protein
MEYERLANTTIRQIDTMALIYRLIVLANEVAPIIAKPKILIGIN